MKKISDRVYEFFELDSDDHNLEVEVYKKSNVKSNVKSKVDYSLYEYYFTKDDCLLLEEHRNEKTLSNVYSQPEINNFVIESKPKSKKDNLVESLNYLKLKPHKTKQDRESIYTLEMILKNM
jgi:hypothetical protein